LGFLFKNIPSGNPALNTKKMPRFETNQHKERCSEFFLHFEVETFFQFFTMNKPILDLKNGLRVWSNNKVITLKKKLKNRFKKRFSSQAENTVKLFYGFNTRANCLEHSRPA
jgi:hypothetical protein